jgi:fructuronate reductase
MLVSSGCIAGATNWQGWLNNCGKRDIRKGVMIMIKLSSKSIKDKTAWQQAGIELPEYDFDQMSAATKANPTWVHFGSGNIFRGFIAMLQQRLLNAGKARTGIVAVETFDNEIIDRIYTPNDNLSLLVLMKPDGTLDKKVVASIGESLVGDESRADDWRRLQDIFTKPCLQMASFTITEKGYGLKKMSGAYYENVNRDMQEGPAHPQHVMAKVAALAYTRYQNGALPIAFVSMDNCSHNGDKLRNSVVTIVKQWVANGKVDGGFLSYINDKTKVSFPWSMIDKITPRPSSLVKDALNAAGFANTEIVCTAKNTYIAPFVNAEAPQYLVVENDFPNGRMPLEAAGVLFTNRVTVDRVEKMKVCTCLNPLHTALAVYGCLLGYNLIADELKNPQLKKLIEKIGYTEGLPVVVNPGIINPEDFIREVIEARLPNANIPDTPQRIASDTSQKVGIRFGETIKAYQQRADLDPAQLTFIPLAIAGWCRYLLGVDDQGAAMPLSPDPMAEELQAYLGNVKLGDVASSGESLKPILSNANIFGLNLYEVGLGAKIEGYFKELAAGKNAVKATLQKYLA